MSKNEKNEKQESVIGEIIGFLKDLLLSFAVIFLVIQFVARPVQVIGRSMYPTLQDGAYGFSNVLSSKLNRYERFDIAIIYIEEKNEYIVKRIIGMPKETVEYRSGVLYIDGQQVEEPFLNADYISTYAQGEFMKDYGPITLGEDEYFCLGDNRPHSSDSRYYGAFSSKQIVAKGIAVLWPLRQMGVHTW